MGIGSFYGGRADTHLGKQVEEHVDARRPLVHDLLALVVLPPRVALRQIRAHHVVRVLEHDGLHRCARLKGTGLELDELPGKLARGLLFFSHEVSDHKPSNITVLLGKNARENSPGFTEVPDCNYKPRFT